MSHTIYRVNTEGGVMYVGANLTEASAGVWVYFGDEPLHNEEAHGGWEEDSQGLTWHHTRYQTADVGHREAELADALAEDNDMGDVLSVDIVWQGT